MIDHYLFLFKSFIGNLLMPLPFSLLLLVWALALLLRRKTRWFGILFVAVATAILFAASYAPLSQPFISAQENSYPAYQQKEEPVDFVVVLGHSHQSDPLLPVTSELTPTAIVRLTEGIRIYRLNPGSKLIFTGMAATERETTSYPSKLRQLAVDLGVPAEDIITLEGPRDTAEEAEIIAANYSDKKLVLVTTAAHMARAMALFEKEGLAPQAAPTGHLVKTTISKWTFPTGSSLAKSEYWAHEQIGLLWAKLTRQIM